MKKRLLAFLLAVSMAVSMLALPAAVAGNANTAVQLSIIGESGLTYYDITQPIVPQADWYAE